MVAGFFLSLAVNYLIIQTTSRTSTRSIGFPLDAADLINSQIQIEYVGLIANIIIWTFALSVVILALQKVFVKN